MERKEILLSSPPIELPPRSKDGKGRGQAGGRDIFFQPPHGCTFSVRRLPEGSQLPTLPIYFYLFSALLVNAALRGGGQEVDVDGGEGPLRG